VATKHATRAGSGSRPSPPRGRATRRAHRRRRARLLRGALAGHERDVAGLAALLGALLVGLSVYASAGGPAGEALAHGIGSLVGIGRFALPPALVWLGVALVRSEGASGADDDEPVSEQVRLAIGTGMLAVALLAMAHLVAGPARWGGPVAAGALWVAVAVLGLLVVTRSTLRSLAGRAALGVAPVHRAARRWVEQVATLSSERTGGVVDVSSRPVEELPPVTVYDVSAEEDDVEIPEVEEAPPPGRGRGRRRPEAEVEPDLEPDAGEPEPEQLAIDLTAGVPGGWKLPSPNLLVRTDAQEVDRRQVEEAGRTLEAALAAHGVETRLVGMTVGPQVTRYELELGPGVKVARVTSLHKDIAYAMASADVRILAPIPGRSAIGVEVPNKTRVVVSLGDILASPEAKRATHPLEVAVGRDIAGRAVLVNLAKLPHVLVAGATGAGKSSCINSIVTSILMRSTPDEVRLILIDPKRVEMGQYSRLPHLLTAVVTNPKKAANALAWAVKEMERRYDLLHEVGFRDITGYNAAYDRGELVPEPGRDVTYERLPYIVIVVDELNDLMMVAARDVEESITRIAQMARAVGLHLVIATQRPSVNVLTGVIKANIPARMAFAVSSLTDSRVILDQPGAERLIGQGDLLLLGPSSSVAQRIQGAWVSEEEVRRVVAFWRRQAPDGPATAIEIPDDAPGGGGGGASGFAGADEDDDEALVLQAMDLVVRSQLGSTSMLQRKLRVGFARAGRIMDLLEQRGVVGPSEGSKARAVLMTVEELEGIQQAQQG